jgi:UDP-N-acetylmuramoyl-tripeptide--D-alanyl-D-alanine ligase
MISTSLSKIASVVSGKLYGHNVIIENISIDSRKIASNCLFIPLIGKKFDAHLFIQNAIKNGCLAFLTQKKIKCFIPFIIVKNTLIALGSIAAWIRKRTNVKVVAITGSCGKTSVKDMTASILQKHGGTIHTINNNNNNIGVAITLLQLTYKHKYAVVELGANKPGEILYSSIISQPNIILINNIHYAHLKGFKSLIGVSKAKSEIFSGMQSNGTVVVNLDNHHISLWKKYIKNKTILYFSIKKKLIFSQKILILIYMVHLLQCIHHIKK